VTDQHAVPADRARARRGRFRKSQTARNRGTESHGSSHLCLHNEGQPSRLEENEAVKKVVTVQEILEKNHFLKGETKMKKVLSAVVLSAAVMATAGQAHAFGNFTLTQALYDADQKVEIGVDHGNLGTDFSFTDTNVVLNTVNYQAIAASYGADAATMKTGFWLDGLVNTGDMIWDIYFVTTTDVAPVASIASSYTAFNSIANTLGAAYGALDADLNGVADRAYQATNAYTDKMNVNSTPGKYAGANALPTFGEINIAAMTGDTQDVYLWHMQYNKGIIDPVTNKLGYTQLIAGAAHDYTAVITFNKVTGESILNPVPVPAAAWLLGSGVLGLIGLRRRNA
jgi:hypothetical protein